MDHGVEVVGPHCAVHVGGLRRLEVWPGSLLPGLASQPLTRCALALCCVTGEAGRRGENASGFPQRWETIFCGH